jgi:hypothetical protein
MIRKTFLYFLFFALTPVVSFSQETVTGLQSNYELTKLKGPESLRKGYQADTVALPFFDDFSGNSVLPGKDRWADDYVFINNTYSDKQITKGVATIDALDNTGRLYENATSTGFSADRLTSLPIYLNYPASVNIRLSFLYEAGGLSDAPEPDDSLTLQFFAPEENKWYSVWRTTGYSGGKGFKTAMIAVNQPRFLKKGFRFRFVNYASVSANLSDPSMIGNCDIWNLEYLYLNANRSAADTTYRDVAFRLPVRSLLKNYEAMPWKQFKQVSLQEMGSFIPIQYRNNDVIVRNVTRNFLIWDMGRNAPAHSFTAGAANIDPGVNTTYNANLIYTYSTDNPDSAAFRITCSLKTDEFDPKQNDTIVYYQVFKNYFAFDDGTSEGGYGINGLGSRNAMLAYRFTSYMQDTLRAIRICFNHSYQESNKRAFDIMVWDDNNGVPGNVIYSKEEVMVENGDPINGFYTYSIPEGVKIEGDFYVGWKQRSETFLNAGFDINTPNKGRQLYWLNGNWSPSQVSGSVMIRPVTGMPFLTGINHPEADKADEVKIWPNPAKDRITLRMKERPYTSSAYISFIDLSGHQLMKVPYSEDIDVSMLKKGMYIVITTINGKQVGHNRLIIK